jgi:HEAT repeat protein
MKPPIRSAFRLVLISACLILFGTGCSKGTKHDLSAVREQLKSPEEQVKQDGCTALAEMGASAKSAIPELIPLLQDADALTRRLAAYALGQIGPAAKSAVPELKKSYRDSDSTVMSTAMNAVQAIDPKAAEGVTIKNIMH